MKIVVGGQIDKQKVYDTIKGVVGDRASVEIKDDIAAAMAVKAGKKAYGFTDQHIEKVVPIILKGLGF